MNATRCPLFLNSIPKSGTHLAAKLLRLMGLRPFPDRHLSSVAERRPPRVAFTADGTIVTENGDVPMAGAVCGLNSLSRFHSVMDGLFGDLDLPNFIQGHHLWSDASENYFSANRIKMLVLLRDPRGIAISHIRWVQNPETGHPLKSYYDGLGMKQRILCEFQGVDPDGEFMYGRNLPLIHRFRNMSKWRGLRSAHFMRFEDLVGRRGGGDDERQREAVAALARFLHLYDAVDMDMIRDRLWGGTVTFRNGMIDGWREHEEDFPPHLAPQIDEMLQIIGQCTSFETAAV